MLTSRRVGVCSVCQGHVGKGELIAYTPDTGAMHPECAGRAASASRSNRRPAPCVRCRAIVEPGEGVLSAIPGPGGRSRWAVACRRCA